MKITEIKKEFKENNSLCIVGTASTWKDAPYNDEEIDFWGLNGLHGYTDEEGLTSQFDLWFQIHSRERVFDQEKHLKWLQEAPMPVLMQEEFPEIPNSIKYPKDEIMLKYRPYFKSTFAWMITLAMELEYEEIYLYGVHVSAKSEYAYQKPNTEYFLGMAEAKGIDVFVPNEADILRAGKLYGYEDERALLDKFDHEIDQLKERKNEIAQRADQARIAKAKYEGAISRDKYWKRILG